MKRLQHYTKLKITIIDLTLHSNQEDDKQTQE